MGFSREEVLKALKENNWNIEATEEALHIDGAEEDDEDGLNFSPVVSILKRSRLKP